MATPSLLLIAHAPALVPDDERPALAARAMEQAFPGVDLSWTISDEGRFIPLPQRDAWIAQELRTGGIHLVCNGDEAFLVSINGQESSAAFSAGGQAQYESHAEWPWTPSSVLPSAPVLSAVAEVARAFWGHLTPSGAALDIALQTSPTLEGPPNPTRGLPPLKLPWEIRAPEVPHHLGWLNYWSAATARLLKFPDPSRDAELLTRSRRTASGGWIVQLTDTPLDLDDPAHLDALLRAYARFPEIGGRAAP
ncbi:DUF5953 family protein [Corallococcus aberystwythensis]|uniref:Immunity protein 52 domain-containing protein n=1 Tax=Corallococcus aberystwythensis TaxID=2316722 RepID=A0A3A8QWE6_9BACT|nr:DUF5953 family protein [Corallococcus aberystwythensis]RKH72058.1 hypothetical protein D7W81_06420 [Corallococcus aberystwythensis]